MKIGILGPEGTFSDKAYMEYVTNRFKFLAEVAPYFRKMMESGTALDGQMRQILNTQALDDAGAVCAAMIKAQLKDKSLNLNTLIQNYISYIMKTKT